MGYTTDFDGMFRFKGPLPDRLRDELTYLQTARHDDRVMPGLYCQWALQYENLQPVGLAWDGGEKFYDYVEWLEYIIELLDDEDVLLEGIVRWRGEDFDDIGFISVVDNKVTVVKGQWPPKTAPKHGA